MLISGRLLQSVEASRRGQRRRSICRRDAGQGSNLVIDSAALYRESRERIAAFVRSTIEEQRAVVVPGCPE